MSLLNPGQISPHQLAYVAGYLTAADDFQKQAIDAPEKSYGLSGRFYISSSGWGLLSVPNSLVRGAFDALDEPGVELPPGKNGQLNAHISVLRPEEIEQIGGADKITERGKSFRYTLGPVKTTNPHGWSEMSRVWFIDVHSPELERFRRSYGLTSLPKENKFRFHITIGVRRTNVLTRSPAAKKG